MHSVNEFLKSYIMGFPRIAGMSRIEALVYVPETLSLGLLLNDIQDTHARDGIGSISALPIGI
jgi:hypothetical protein